VRSDADSEPAFLAGRERQSKSDDIAKERPQQTTAARTWLSVVQQGFEKSGKGGAITARQWKQDIYGGLCRERQVEDAAAEPLIGSDLVGELRGVQPGFPG